MGAQPWCTCFTCPMRASILSTRRPVSSLISSRSFVLIVNLLDGGRNDLARLHAPGLPPAHHVYVCGAFGVTGTGTGDAGVAGAGAVCLRRLMLFRRLTSS